MNKQSYIKEIAKKLACSRDKRAEFTRQLASDIESALESGEHWDAILERLGTPTEVAREINESLGEAAASYRKRTHRILGIISGLAAAILTAAILFFTLPGNEANTTPEPLSKDTVTELSQNAIERFSDGDFESLIARCDDKLKDMLSVDYLKQMKEELLPDIGEFQGIKKSSVIRINEEDADYVTVQTQVLYKKQTVTFTLSWNDREELCGFYFK